VKGGGSLLATQAQMTARFREIGETLLVKATPALKGLADFTLTKAIPAFSTMWTWTATKLIPGIRAFAATIAERAQPIVKAIGEYLSTRVIPAFAGLAARVRENAPPFIALAKVVGGVVLWLAGKLIPIILKVAGPVLTVMFASLGKLIGILGGVIRWAGYFGQKIADAFGAVARAGLWMWNSVLKPTFAFLVRAWFAVAGAIVHGAATAFGWVPGVGPKLRAAAREFDKFRDRTNAALGGVRSRTVTITTKAQIPAGVSIRQLMEGRAAGGLVPGAPSSRDNVMLPMATGEYVVNARQTRRFLPLLEAINAGRLRGLASGGLVPRAVTAGVGDLGLFAAQLNRGVGWLAREIGQGLLSVLRSAVSVPGAPANVSGNAALVRSMAASMYGWVGAQWNALYRLIMKESGFRNTAQNPTSTAYGMFQFLNSTWAGVGGHKTSDPRLQTIYGLSYIRQRYGTPAGALSFHLGHNWYGAGGVIGEPIFGVGRSGRTYTFGESGPETVVPGIARRGGGGTTVVNIHVSANTVVADKRELGRLVEEAREKFRAGGGRLVS